MTSFPQLTRRTFFEADLIDRQKEIEERQLYQWEEREKEREAATTAAGKKGRSSPATQRAVQQVKKTKGFFFFCILRPLPRYLPTNNIALTILL